MSKNIKILARSDQREISNYKGKAKEFFFAFDLTLFWPSGRFWLIDFAYERGGGMKNEGENAREPRRRNEKKKKKEEGTKVERTGG